MSAPAGGFRGRGAVVAAVTLLAVLFPALMAGAGIDAPVRDGEVVRVEQAIADPKGELGGPAVLYYGALLPADVHGLAPAQLRAQVKVSRLGSVLGVFVSTALLYLAVMIARGRGRAVLACVAFGCLPPVAHDGSILRPEVPALAFALLGLLIFLGLPAHLRAGRRQPWPRAWAVVLAVSMAVATAFGLAIACLSRYGIVLLIPAACLAMVVLLQGHLVLRVLRRTRLLILPFRAFALRMLPWLLTAFLSILIPLVILQIGAQGVRPTAAPVGLLPAPLWAAIPLCALAALGGLVFAVEVGLRTGRRRRVTADTILLTFALVLLVHRLKIDPLADALPAAPALAILIAEGGRIVLLLAAGSMIRARPGR